MNVTASAVLNNPQSGPWTLGDMKAAPVNLHTTAATLLKPGFQPEALGGVVVFDDGVLRPDFLPGWTGGQTVPAIYDEVAWSATDQVLAATPAYWDNGLTGPLYELQVDSSGVGYLGQGTADFNTQGGEIHSDFGTGRIYSDDGTVADPGTGVIVGNYQSSGLVMPDSSLNRVFILGQTTAQQNTNDFTIQSFDQKAFTLLSSITISNISGYPVQLVRYGNSGLAVITMGGVPDVFENGLGTLYLVTDSNFVSNLQPSTASPSEKERVQQRWKRMPKRKMLKMVQQMAHRGAACCNAGTPPQ